MRARAHSCKLAMSDEEPSRGEASASRPTCYEEPGAPAVTLVVTGIIKKGGAEVMEAK